MEIASSSRCNWFEDPDLKKTDDGPKTLQLTKYINTCIFNDPINKTHNSLKNLIQDSRTHQNAPMRQSLALHHSDVTMSIIASLITEPTVCSTVCFG